MGSKDDYPNWPTAFLIVALTLMLMAANAGQDFWLQVLK